MILDPTRQPDPRFAETIRWQSTVRIVLGLVTGAVAVPLSTAGYLPASARSLLACVAGYLALVTMVRFVARRMRGNPRAAIAALLLADLLLVFAGMALLSRPEYLDRSLVLSFIVLHVAAFSFGRGYSYLVAGGAMVGYAMVVMTIGRRGGALDVAEEMLSVAIFLAAAVLFTLQHDALRLRARKVTALFGAAEGGDFSQEYDVGADRVSDVVTDIGRAYNRLQVALQSMVLTDPLTGCLNRRGFDQALGREIARSTRAGSELALLAIDLDHFKHLNDRCGHLAGDAILRDLGNLLRQSARAGDVVARTGGEEFTLVLPDTDADGAFQVATRICERIREREFAAGSRLVRITVSVGVAAAAGPTVDRLGQELKLRADQALYAAKRLGRDRVLTWSA